MKIPCEECLTFVMCKQRIQSMNRPDLNNFSNLIKCTMLMDHIDEIFKRKYFPNRTDGYINEINKGRKLFDLNIIPSKEERRKRKR